ncbi:hypothetical protein C0J52_07760 [Blattella germanica]|nr:hypothetical protein C0J52_07760 [Blattella germanica]
MDSNTGYRPPIQAQVQYVVEWFNEWSEMQRGDFLPVLAQQFVPSSYVNGLVSGIEGMGCRDDRPPSLFQCRIKLFREWSETWGAGEREQLLNRIKAVDAAFASKYEEEINSAAVVGDKVVSPQTNSPTEFDQEGSGDVD